MNTESHLLIHEEILLLALHEEKGTTCLGGWFSNAMGGAIFSELVLRKAIAVSDDKHKKVSLLDPTLCGEPLLDECLTMIRLGKKEKKAAHWVTKFAGLKNLKNRAARRLVFKGILTEDQDKVLGLFKRTLFPEADHGPEAELRNRLRRAIFTDTADLEGRTVVVVALCNAAQMLPGIFDKKELKSRKERIKQLTNGNVAAQATKETVEAIQAAVIVSALIVTSAT